MGDKSRIEWTDATWNPITGCTPISEGCANCYAKREAEGRLRGRCGYDKDDPFRVTVHLDRMDQPSRWTKPRRIFVCSMGDLFHDDVPRALIGDVFNEIYACRQHTFLILTKRPDRMRLLMRAIEGGSACNFWVGDESGAEWVTIPFAEAFPHVWLGVTAENQARADERIPILLDTPAAVRFVSVEPMLGPVDLRPHDDFSDSGKGPSYLTKSANVAGWRGLDWVICGGETGQQARPMNPNWARGLRDQCVASKTAFFFKQWGEYCAPSQMPEGAFRAWDYHHGTENRWKEDDPRWKVGKKAAGRLLDGRTWDEYPEGRRG